MFMKKFLVHTHLLIEYETEVTVFTSICFIESKLNESCLQVELLH